MSGLGDLLDRLASGDGWFAPGEDADPVDLLAHSLQCADLLAAHAPGDVELQLAGLFHDVGHLGVVRTDGAPGGDDHHEQRGEELLRPVLGPRVGRLVGLHVAAKRFLAATDAAYREELSGGSTVSLRRQGGAMDDREIRALRSDPLLDAAVTLRRADDAAKEPGRATHDLEWWRRRAVDATR